MDLELTFASIFSADLNKYKTNINCNPVHERKLWTRRHGSGYGCF